MPLPHEAYSRSSVLVPVETRQLTALVVGAGMVGSWTAAALARMLKRVVVIDFDNVDIENVGVQLYTPDDVGSPKTDAVLRYVGGLPVDAFNVEMEDFQGRHGRFSEFDVVVSAVDSMEGRKWLAEECQGLGVSLLVDVRVLGEMVCILTAKHLPKVKGGYLDYLETILPDDQVEEATCGSEGTVYSGLFAASRVAAVVNNWARGALVRPKEVWHVGMMEHLDKEVTHGEGT